MALDLTQVHQIPVAEIHPDAIPRDRLIHDPDALSELRASIEAEGLRQPIELFGLEPDEQGRQYGLISGYRRLSVFRALGRDTIPAFLRNFPGGYPDLLSAMVTENEIRSQISPWEKAMFVLTCLRGNTFPNADTAIDALFPALSRQKRSRLRGHVMVAEAFEYGFATPERLSVSRLDRLAAALRSGWDDILRSALPHHKTHSLESQWQAILPILTESAAPPSVAGPAPDTPGAPRRLRNLRKGLTVRRELTRSGWILRFTGPQAKSPGIIDDVMDEVERIFSPD